MISLKNELIEYSNNCIYDKANINLEFEALKPSEYSNDQKEAIDFLKIKSAVPYGSFKLRASKYPSDIDVLEEIGYYNTKEEAVKKFKKEFVKIVKKIYKHPKYYIGDIKCGMDEVYNNINIGYLLNGYVKDFDYDRLLNLFETLYKNKYLEKEEIDEIKKLLYEIKNNNNVKAYDELEEFIRKKATLRWSYEDIVKGYLILAPNRKKTLLDAIDDISITKIDMFAPVDGIYTETTMFYLLGMIKNKKIVFINQPYNFWEVRVEGLKDEIEKMFYNHVFYNPLKGSKRVFAYARLTGDKKMVKIISPLLSSEAVLLGKIKSDLELLVNMIRYVNQPPYEILYKQLDMLKPKIGHMIEFKNMDIQNKINEILKKKYKGEKFIDNVKQIQEMIKERIYPYIIKYLKKNNIYPIPLKYLPDQLKYNYEEIKNM